MVGQFQRIIRAVIALHARICIPLSDVWVRRKVGAPGEKDNAFRST